MRANVQKRALILIDVQNEYVTGKLPIEYPPLKVSLLNIGHAIAHAKERGIPIVIVKQMAPETSPIFASGSSGAELHPVVNSIDADLVVEKSLPSALAGTGLGDWLKNQGIETLVVAGFMSQNCVESTIRHAAHEGWQVEYLHDASGTVSFENKMGFLSAQAMHEAVCIVLQSRFAAVLQIEEWCRLVVSGVAAHKETILGNVEQAKKRHALND
jgi:nicotinamidase-related amidase